MCYYLDIGFAIGIHLKALQCMSISLRQKVTVVLHTDSTIDNLTISCRLWCGLILTIKQDVKSSNAIIVIYVQKIQQRCRSESPASHL